MMGIYAIPSHGADERFPPPEFTEGHELPETEAPRCSASGDDWAMLGVFVVLLVTATFLTLKLRSRRGLWILAFISVLLLGFYKEGCVCAVGSIQNAALALGDPSYAIPLTVLAVFLLPLFAALLFGRVFCSSVCPLGAIQELVAIRPIKVPEWLDHSLGLFRHVYLALAVFLAGSGVAMLICRYDPFVGFFRLNGSATMIIFGAAILILGVFVGRPYCRYACPYGALLGILSKVSMRRPRITPAECVSCRLCEEACPYGAIQRPTTAPTSEIRNQGRRRLAIVLAIAPFLIVAGAYFARFAAVPLSMMHPVVQASERMRMEELEIVSETNDISEAFRKTGQTNEQLYKAAGEIQERLRGGLVYVGAYLGLVFAAKLIQLSIRRKREEHDLDPSRCFACGRCYAYCPVEQARRGLITEIPLPPPPDESA
jgi:NosR/NirI family transcriptional regulator, nitrous oxide reductase regulator